MREQVEMLEHHSHLLAMQVDVRLRIRDVHALEQNGQRGDDDGSRDP